MSLEHLSVKGNYNYVIWRNIPLPDPEVKETSFPFRFGTLNFYFELTCSLRMNQVEYAWDDIDSFEDHLYEFKIEFPYCSRCLDFYGVIPYVKFPEKYVRVDMNKIWRSSISSAIDKNRITVLFFFEPSFLNKPLDITEISERNDPSFEATQSLCLDGLSKDILQLFNKDGYADATLKSGDKSFHVHRNILTARSEVFAAMFRHDMSEKNSGTVDIVDIDPNILEQFLRYLYSGSVEQMSMDTVFELYNAAQKYAVFTLKKLCLTYILKNMSKDIICKVLVLADEAGSVEFLDSAAYYTARHEEIEDFLKSAEWKDFAKKYPNIAVKVYFEYHD